MKMKNRAPPLGLLSHGDAIHRTTSSG